MIVGTAAGSRTRSGQRPARTDDGRRARQSGTFVGQNAASCPDTTRAGRTPCYRSPAISGEQPGAYHGCALNTCPVEIGKDQARRLGGVLNFKQRNRGGLDKQADSLWTSLINGQLIARGSGCD